MLLSRPVFYSALISCFAHSVALGFAATLIVTAPQQSSRPLIQVKLVQRAAPLPIGGNVVAEKPESAPASLERPQELMPTLPIQPPPKPQPVAKPKRRRSAPPKVVRTPLPPSPPPAVEQSPEPQEPPIQVAAVTSAVTTSAGTDDASSLKTEAVVEGGADTTKKGKENGIAKAESDRGGRPGVAAQPDYGLNPKPPYPMLARRLGAQGVVLLRVQVREDGTVETVELARSSGFSVLDDSAARTVRESWRFVPARIDGVPIASWVEVPIRFVLEDS